MMTSELRVGDVVACTCCASEAVHDPNDGRSVTATIVARTFWGDPWWSSDPKHRYGNDSGSLCERCTIHRVTRDGAVIFDDSKPARTYGDGECIATDAAIDHADHEALRVALVDMAKAMVEIATERDELRLDVTRLKDDLCIERKRTRETASLLDAERAGRAEYKDCLIKQSKVLGEEINLRVDAEMARDALQAELDQARRDLAFAEKVRDMAISGADGVVAELEAEQKRRAATAQCFDDFKREMRERCK